MKLLGHAWVAVNGYPHGNRKLLILGSVLPEIMYYTKDHPFSFEEIHEGGDKVYDYLKRNNQAVADLGLGMLSHSVKAGADKFNLDENLAILGYSGDKVDRLRNRLSEVLNITYDTAKTRAHNILELAVELKIVQANPGFVKDFNVALCDRKNTKVAVQTLSSCFDKPYDKVEQSVNELLAKAKPDYFEDARGLANLWAELSKEFDPPPKIEELAALLEDLSYNYNGRDEKFLEKCIGWTKTNLKSFVEKTKQ